MGLCFDIFIFRGNFLKSMPWGSIEIFLVSGESLTRVWRGVLPEIYKLKNSQDTVVLVIFPIPGYVLRRVCKGLMLRYQYFQFKEKLSQESFVRCSRDHCNFARNS